MGTADKAGGDTRDMGFLLHKIKVHLKGQDH